MKVETAILLAALLVRSAGAAPPEGFAVRGQKAAAHPHLTEAAATARGPSGRGVALFGVRVVPASATISPEAWPADPGPGELAVADCPGQYGPVTFLVWSARACTLSAKVSGLRSAAGGSIGPEHFDLRVARYVRVSPDSGAQVQPLLLEALERKALPASGVAQVWITYFVPPDTPAGTYEGRVTVTAGEHRRVLPLVLRVYPFTLTEPEVNLYLYYTAPEGARQLDRVRQQLLDQRCHGMNCAQVSVPVTREGELVEGSLARMLDLYQSVGFARSALFVDLYNRITAEWLNTPDASIGMWGPWFRYYPFSEELDTRYLRTVASLRAQMARRGGRMILAVADEPGSHAWTTAATPHYNALVGKAYPDVLRELTVGGGWAMQRDEEALWKNRIEVWTANRWLPERIERVRRDDPEAVIQVYNMAGGGSSPGGSQAARLFYGFFNWKARAGGAAQWCYHHPGTPGENYTWPAENPLQGHVPTLRWEAVREGCKDRRYLATLESLLEPQPGASGKRADVVAEARQLLRTISGRISLGSLETDDVRSGGRILAHPPGTYEQWRAQIAECILKLRDASP